MAGYSRQSAADIIANAVIKAAPVNAEYNALRDAFLLSGGHKHDGSSTEGGYVPLIADSDALNKVVIDTSNNRIGFFSEVGGAAVEQVRIQDGAIVPVTDNDVDLGSSTLQFKDLYIDGVGYLDSVDIDGGSIDGVTIGGSSAGAGTFSSLVATTADINAGTIDNAVIGGSTASSGSFTTIAASSNATVGGTLGVTGNVTMGGTLAVTGTTALTGTATITSADINSGAMDNTTIGNTTAAAGTFTDLTSTGTSTHATVDINGGAIDGVTIGAASAGAGTFTDLTASGTTTVTTADINGGNIDGTIIGASSAAAGSFTTISTTGQATLATADINGGSIDGAVIGSSSAAAITGTTITGTSLVGTVTGNVTGDLTGDVTGDVTGDLTGNVTAGSGSSTFNNVTVNGTLDVTGTTIANVTDPSSAQDAATKNYVDTEVAALVDSAPGTLDTLNELAAALNDDPNFSTTITNSIATKLPLAGGTMSGAIAMGTSKITGLGDPTADQDAATKKYTTDTFLPLAGGTVTGAIDMGSNKITASYTPSANTDLATKIYVDNIAGSGTAAAASATAAASSATAAASSATAAASSATGAASSATSAAASFDSFDDRYLGAKSSAPSTDNDGDALQVGTLYFNTTTNSMQVYGGSGFTAAGSSVNGTSSRNTYTATAGQTSFAATYDSGFVDVYLNGVKLLAGTDFTATNGTSVVLASGAAVNDIVDIVAYGTFTLSTHYTKTEADALLATKQPYATIAVTVVNSGGNKYALDGTVQQLAQLRPSITYRFDQSDSSNSGHPLRLSTTSNGTHGGGSAFTTGVTAVGTPGSAGAYTEVKLEQDAPNTLYYYCTNHSGMGGEVDVNAKLPLSGGTLTGGLTGTTATFTGDLTVDTSTLKVDSTNNRVGIGTSSPSRQLTLSHTSQAEIGLFSGSDTSGGLIYQNASEQKVLLANRESDGHIAFQTGGTTERMRIDSSGNVGIGDSAPVSTLEISKSDQTNGTTLTITNAFSGGSWAVDDVIGSIDFRSDDASSSELTRGRIQSVTDNVTGTNWSYGTALTFSTAFNNTLSERLRIDSSGNVLLKTLGAALQWNNGYQTITGQSTANDLTYRTYQSHIFKNTTSASSTTDGTEVMRIDSSGKVGIGTSSPSRKLSVYDSSAPYLALQNSTSGSTSGDGLQFQLASANSYLWNYENGFMAFATNNAERLRIDSSGNFFLGKTSAALGTAGLQATSGGAVVGITRDGGASFNLNRLTSDGEIMGFFKDTTQVGGIASVNGNIKVSAYGEEYASLSGTSVTIDCRAGNNFALTTSGNTTFTFSNVPTSGTAFGFTLKLTSGGSHTIAYPNTVDFAGGTAPDAPASGETDVLVFYTVDGGTNWYGALAIDAAG
jgi:hypothetical protein